MYYVQICLTLNHLFGFFKAVNQRVTTHSRYIRRMSVIQSLHLQSISQSSLLVVLRNVGILFPFLFLVCLLAVFYTHIILSFMFIILRHYGK